MNKNKLTELARYQVRQGYDFCPLFIIKIEPFEGNYKKVTLKDVQSFFDKRSNPKPLLPPSDKEHQRRLRLIGL